MTVYATPLKDIQFVLNEIAGIEGIRKLPPYEQTSQDIVTAILEEASRVAQQQIAPLNPDADRHGATLIDGEVTASPGFKEAYKDYVDGGWGGLAYDPEFGGQGLPHLLSTSVAEIWQTSSLAFALCPMLTSSAVNALYRHGSDELKATYLEKIVSGEWTGTMQLTEPQAGTDLAAIKTRAIPEIAPDGSQRYRMFGQKIFITWGDHNMTDNILHFVLARVEGAPDGIRGLSLFLVPKYNLDEHGMPAERNDVKPLSLEHKLGIHGSPTCVMSFGDKDGALAYLIGEENQGINCMFTMMNSARLEVGLQGLSVSERAYQQARAFAAERVQGNDVHGNKVRIIEFPDVRRMLMLMKSQTEAMRAAVYVTAAEIDRAEHSENKTDRARAASRVDLLIPVVKGWCTESSQEITGLNVQLHGGMGFIEETGAAQHYRDARILTIYEGTTGIQAGDFVRRKLIRDNGQAMSVLLEDINDTLTELDKAGANFTLIREQLGVGANALKAAVDNLLISARDDVDQAGAASVNMLMLAGVVLGGWLMARSALVAANLLSESGADTDYLQGKIDTARFYAAHVLPRSSAYLIIALNGSDVVMSVKEEQFC